MEELPGATASTNTPKNHSFIERNDESNSPFPGAFFVDPENMVKQEELNLCKGNNKNNIDNEGEVKMKGVNIFHTQSCWAMRNNKNNNDDDNDKTSILSKHGVIPLIPASHFQNSFIKHPQNRRRHRRSSLVHRRELGESSLASDPSSPLSIRSNNNNNNNNNNNTPSEQVDNMTSLWTSSDSYPSLPSLVEPNDADIEEDNYDDMSSGKRRASESERESHVFSSQLGARFCHSGAMSRFTQNIYSNTKNIYSSYHDTAVEEDNNNNDPMKVQRCALNTALKFTDNDVNIVRMYALSRLEEEEKKKRRQQMSKK